MCLGSDGRMSNVEYSETQNGERSVARLQEEYQRLTCLALGSALRRQALHITCRYDMSPHSMTPYRVSRGYGCRILQFDSSQRRERLRGASGLDAELAAACLVCVSACRSDRGVWRSTAMPVCHSGRPGRPTRSLTSLLTARVIPKVGARDVKRGAKSGEAESLW